MSGLFDEPIGATPLDADEAADLIPDIATRGELNEWEATNILRAEDWLFRRKRPGLLTERFVRELHRRMFNETWKWAGTYRTSGKNIGVPAFQIAPRVRETCENVALWVAERVFPIDEIAVRLHHNMVSVHPFPNGNGRHTRLLADALLFQHEEPRLSWGTADLMDASEAREHYLFALRRADELDYGPLIAFARS